MIYDDYVQYTQQYKAKYGEQTVVMIEIGSFWELYNCDKDLGAKMREVCSLLNITVSRKNKNIPEVSAANPMMAGFPSHALAKFLPILVENDYTVVLVGQVTPPPNPKRDVVGIYSKGTYLPDGSDGAAAAAGGSARNNYIMVVVVDTCVHPIRRTLETCVGVARCDVTTGDVTVGELTGEFIGDDLYKLYSSVRPSELLIYKTSEQCDRKYLSKMLSAAPAGSVKDYTALACDDFISSRPYQEFILGKAYGETSETSDILSVHERLNLERLLFGTYALVALLRYVMDHDPALMRNLRVPQQHLESDSSHMDLYYNCAEQLELGAVVKVLNKCVTPIGKRFFKRRLYNPFSDPVKIGGALDRTALFLDGGEFERVRMILSDVDDLERLFRRICIGKIHPFEIVRVAESLTSITGLGNPAVSSACERLVATISHHLNLEACGSVSFESLAGQIFAQGRDVEFDKLVSSQVEIFRSFEEAVACWNDACGKIACFKFERNERDGLYVSVTAKRYDAVEARVKEACSDFGEYSRCGLSGTNTHIKLSSKAMRDAERTLGELDAEVLSLTKEKYARFLDGVVKEHRQAFDLIVDFVGEVDFHSCAAMLAKRHAYVMPSLCQSQGQSKCGSSSWLVAKQMRHPLVELLDTDHTYVPNDIDLRDGQQQWLLYGLNAAGKSTLMKMVALNVIMAQCGMFVPCSEMELAPYGAIYTRISKGDDIMSGQSTFMVEISELRNVLAKAGPSSLVIGDELCAGTETQSAIAIVHTGVRYLIKSGATFIFATHLHELVSEFDNGEVHVCHLHVEYDQENMALRYDRLLRDGDGPKTYGVEVCKALGLPASFVSDAIGMRQRLENGGRLSSMPKVSQYNSSLMYDEVCQVCGQQCVNDSEVHHIKQQSGYVGPGVHARRNLIVLCSKCHDSVHAGTLNVELELVKRQGTTTGLEGSVQNAPNAPNAPNVSNIDEYIQYLRNQLKLSIPKISDRVYSDCGVKMSAYKIGRVLATRSKI